MVARSGDAATGFRALWPSCGGGTVGCVGSGGVECVCRAGRPPLFERSDGATTLSETVAADRPSIDDVLNEEIAILPGVGPRCSRQTFSLVEYIYFVYIVVYTGVGGAQSWVPRGAEGTTGITSSATRLSYTT